MAGTTGFEPATSDVTGRRSNQLNYVPALLTTPSILARTLLQAASPRPEGLYCPSPQA